MIISAIVAMSIPDRAIGVDGELPWYLSSDLKFFKKTTINKTIIMGRKSFESIGRPLPKRNNIVITRDPYYIATGTIISHSIEEALSTAHDIDEKSEVFIIGGGQIYAQAMQYCDRLYITEVKAEIKGDTYFPEFEAAEWKEVSRESHQADEKNDHDFDFVLYERIIQAES